MVVVVGIAVISTGLLVSLWQFDGFFVSEAPVHTPRVSSSSTGSGFGEPAHKHIRLLDVAGYRWRSNTTRIFLPLHYCAGGVMSPKASSHSWSPSTRPRHRWPALSRAPHPPLPAQCR